MAGNSYRLLLQAQIDQKTLDAQIKAAANKSQIILSVKYKDDDLTKLENALDQIKLKASSISKVTIAGDTKGGISSALVEYKDQIGNITRQQVEINSQVQATQRYTMDIARSEAEIVRQKERQAALDAKDADEMQRIMLSTEKFLARTQTAQSSPQLNAARSIALNIQKAVSAGDVDRVRELNRELEISKAGLAGATENTNMFGNAMRSAATQAAAYVASIVSIYAAMNQLREGVKYVSDLNAEMTKIQVLQIEGARSGEEITNLALQYNRLGKEIGATTIEVAKGSVEWLRQGKTIAETQELLKSTVMLSKLGNLDTAQSTEYLTAIVNGFKLSAEDASHVVDKLIAIDNIAATSAGELATALQYSAAVAQQTGVDFNTLNAYIGTVSSTTRLSAETIGQALVPLYYLQS